MNVLVLVGVVKFWSATLATNVECQTPFINIHSFLYLYLAW